MQHMFAAGFLSAAFRQDAERVFVDRRRLSMTGGNHMYAVNSVLSINTNPEPNPDKATRHAGLTLTGKNAVGTSFVECLESHIQQANANTISAQGECQKIGVLMGFVPPFRLSPRPETAPKPVL